MKLLFQNDHGEVSDIIGLKLSGLTCMYDNESGRDQFFCAYLYVDKQCIGIGVNDLYCEVCECDYDQPSEDVEEDDCFSLRNHDDWVRNKTITQATVSCEEKMRMAIHLSDGTIITMESDENCNGSFERVLGI